MGNNTSTSSHASTFSRGQGTSSNIRDALPSLPGSQPKNKTGRKVTAQKMKTARATGVLALQEHGLKEVPEELFQLVNLRTLNLASNSLKILPTAIGTLTKLKTMRLDSNKLEALPDLSALLALTDLSAGGNSLRGAEALGSRWGRYRRACQSSRLEITAWERFHLRCSAASRCYRKVTAPKIKTARATGVLALQEHGLKEVPEELFQLVNLRTLNSLKILPTAVGTLTKLKTMRLDSNKLESGLLIVV